MLAQFTVRAVKGTNRSSEQGAETWLPGAWGNAPVEKVGTRPRHPLRGSLKTLFGGGRYFLSPCADFNLAARFSLF
jgi:hypothetical protein